MHPSIAPSVVPTTAMPTSAPSITGSVALVQMSGIVTSTISTTDATVDVATAYGVDVNDITISTEYVSTGALDVTIPDDIPTVEAIAALAESISEVLGVHQRDVDVSIDPVTGEVTYEISGNEFENVESLVTLMEDPSFATQLNDVLDVIEVNDVAINPDITAVTIHYFHLNFWKIYLSCHCMFLQARLT